MLYVREEICRLNLHPVITEALHYWMYLPVHENSDKRESPGEARRRRAVKTPRLNRHVM